MCIRDSSQAETFFSRGRGESYEPERIALFRRWSYAAGAARAPGVTLTEDDREGVERALELMSRRDWSAAQDQWRQLEPRLGRAKAFAYLQADLRLYSALGRAAQGDDPAATVSAYNDALAALDTLPLDEKEAIVRDETGRLLACLLYTSDAADERSSVDLGGRRIIKKKTHRQCMSERNATTHRY